MERGHEVEKTFEDYFSELQSDIVNVCLEYVEEQAERVYVYGACEDSVAAFDVFYEIGGLICRKEELGSVGDGTAFQHAANPNMQKELENIGKECMEDLEVLCREFYMQMPTELKLIYDVASNDIRGEYAYDLHWQAGPDGSVRGPEDIFTAWFEEVRDGTGV
jgi:hypothetical protein